MKTTLALAVAGAVATATTAAVATFLAADWVYGTATHLAGMRRLEQKGWVWR